MPLRVTLRSGLSSFHQQRPQLPKLTQRRWIILRGIPFIVAAEFSEKTRPSNSLRIDQLGFVLVGAHINRIPIAIEFAHITSLTLIQARDERPSRH